MDGTDLQSGFTSICHRICSGRVIWPQHQNRCPPIHRIHFQATWMPQDCGARATVPNWIGTRFLNLFFIDAKGIVSCPGSHSSA